MDDTTRLRLIIIGLILASIAGGYFIYSQKIKAKPKTTPVVTLNQPVQQIQPVITPTPAATPVILEQAAQGQNLPTTGVSTLPTTGIPTYLWASFALSVGVIGWSLKKFPE